MKHIVLTGGGTAGHVTPNIALIPKLKEAGYKISYIGSYDGMERKLIEDLGIPYYGISSGKLRRYFDPKNFSDPFRVVKGYFEAKKLLKKLKPNVVFSKGGFVSVPVVLAAKACKVPALIHESDMTPGLANKLCIPSAAKVCCNFPETVKCLPENKAVLIIAHAKKLQERGARNVLVSMAKDGAILVTEDGEIYKKQPHNGTVVNSVGAGDSMVAGFLAGYLNTGSYERALELGTAAGSATAFQSWLASREDIVKLLDRPYSEYQI